MSVVRCCSLQQRQSAACRHIGCQSTCRHRRSYGLYCGKASQRPVLPVSGERTIIWLAKACGLLLRASAVFRIFISYRRGDTRDVAQRLFERVSKQFGKSVFCDVDGVKVGDNFRESLLNAVETCDVMVVVIGTQWFGVNPDGSRRIDDENDWVLREVSSALQRNIPVIPVLIYPARQPMEEDLPLAIKELAFRESITVYNDKQFESSVRTVIDSLVVLEERRAGRLGLLAIRTRRSLSVLRHPLAIATLLLATVAVGLGTWWVREKVDSKGRRVDDTVVNTWERADRMKLQKEIEAMKARSPEPVTDRPADTETESSLGSPDYASFDILSDERFWDLRGWVDLSEPANKDRRSLAIMTRTARILKAAAAKEIRFEARTDGADVFLTCLSHKEKAREILQDQTSFVGARSTRVRQLVVDVDDITVSDEFIVKMKATYVDSLQDPKDRWIGAIGYPRSDRIRIVVLMPIDRPLKGFRLQTAPSTRDEPQEYSGPRRLIESDDGLSLMWEVPNPEAGFVYSVVMDW